jgi:hypothetical protein
MARLGLGNGVQREPLALPDSFLPSTQLGGRPSGADRGYGTREGRECFADSRAPELIEHTVGTMVSVKEFAEVSTMSNAERLPLDAVQCEDLER